MRFYCEEKEAVMQAVKSSENGLSAAEAAKRLEENGKNRLEAAKGKTIVQRFLEQLADPMIIILLVAAAMELKPFSEEFTAFITSLLSSQ